MTFFYIQIQSIEVKYNAYNKSASLLDTVKRTISYREQRVAHMKSEGRKLNDAKLSVYINDAKFSVYILDTVKPTKYSTLKSEESPKMTIL